MSFVLDNSGTINLDHCTLATTLTAVYESLLL